MNWRIYVRSKASKQLKRLPIEYIARIERTIDEMAVNPFGGDVEKMEGKAEIWRRRIGAYRIKYEIFFPERIVNIFEIKRRTSNTY
ncbi:MAG: type II toxin-antitoxin system RelE/ParE family toxin [Candidatus Sungbacteria bacterium]|nr:type II toxin-antitoxin system RelE/ParE family toxin [Candidatus Sungbacteria bacterium]